MLQLSLIFTLIVGITQNTDSKLQRFDFEIKFRAAKIRRDRANHFKQSDKTAPGFANRTPE